MRQTFVTNMMNTKASMYGTGMKICGLLLFCMYFIGIGSFGNVLKGDSFQASSLTSSPSIKQCRKYLEDDSSILEVIRRDGASSSLSINGVTIPLETRLETSPNSPPRFPRALRNIGDCILGRHKMIKLIQDAHDVTEVQFNSQKVLLTSHRDDDSIKRHDVEFGDGENKRFSIEREGQDPTKPPLILDIGANLGFVSIFFFKLHPDVQIVAFEPNPFTYMYFLWNLYINNVPILTAAELQLNPSAPGVYPVFGGVSGLVDGEAPFSTVPMPMAFSEKSQLHIVDHNQDGGKHGVKLYNLPEFMKKHDLMERGFNVVKLDCECCEYVVVPANKNLFSNRDHVKHLVGELHSFEKCMEYFNLDMSAQMQTVEALEQRGCPVLDYDFDENHFVGSKTEARKCCPIICVHDLVG